MMRIFLFINYKNSYQQKVCIIYLQLFSLTIKIKSKTKLYFKKRAHSINVI